MPRIKGLRCPRCRKFSVWNSGPQGQTAGYKFCMTTECGWSE